MAEYITPIKCRLAVSEAMNNESHEVHRHLHEACDDYEPTIWKKKTGGCSHTRFWKQKRLLGLVLSSAPMCVDTLKFLHKESQFVLAISAGELPKLARAYEKTRARHTLLGVNYDR
jgi:hypothetical protein